MPHYFDDDPTVASAPRSVELALPDIHLTLTTDRGVFGYGQIDAATKLLLLKAPPPAAEGDLLDLGCGTGAIALTMARRAPRARVWAIDVNARARELCAVNAAVNGITNVTVAAPDEVPAGVSFTTIWTNPPIRIGKPALHDLLQRWFARLTAGGEAILVVSRHLGADSLQRWLTARGYPTERLASAAGLRILAARRGVVLHGGVANAGLVVRFGDEVHRPRGPHTETVHRFLTALDANGFDGAPQPLGITADGRERLRFIPGDVPLVPYPAWAQSDAALASLARLMRRFHDAAAQVPIHASDHWSDEMADPQGGEVVCHNDVCLENVVFRDGKAVALLDFDFAAPGRSLYDLACMARMCVPVDDPSRSRFGFTPADLPARLRIVADAYGLAAGGRQGLVEIIGDTIARGGEFLQRKVAAGDPNFTAMWESTGGMARFDRRRDWWAEGRPEFEAAMA